MKAILTIKRNIFEILDSKEGQQKPIHYTDDVFISTLIILSVISIILESFSDFYTEHKLILDSFDIFTVFVFSVEYSLRIWIADLKFPELGKIRSRLKYIFSFLGLVDLLAILPYYIPMLIKMDLRFVRVLRLLRLFRIFKLAHYSTSIRLVGRVIKDKRQELFITLFGTFIIILITSSLMFTIEHEVQPDKFPNILATFWWAIATLTTIGYGDVYPVTGLGQTLAAITAILGIGLVAIPTGILSMGFIDELSKSRSKKKDKEVRQFDFCPHCGEKLKNQ